MALRVKNKRGPAIPPVEGGTYPAICVCIVDLGEQLSEQFKKYEDRVLLIWELPGVTVEIDGEQKPRWLSKDFSATLNEKSNLTKFLVPWRGRPFTDDELNGDGFDLKEMLGKGCLLQVIVEEKDGKQYNRITGVVGFPVGMPIPVTETELLSFDMDAWDDDAMSKLPEWVQGKIKKSTQYQKDHAPTDEIKVQAATDAPAIDASAYTGGQSRPPLQTNNGSTTRSGGVPF